jgi:type IV pilus assembly protein PilW
MSTPRLPPRLVRRRDQAGLTLVEIMVALTIGAVVAIGIIQLFTAGQQTYRTTVGQAVVQENARFAMEFIASPLRMAGFTGCFSNAAETNNVLNPVGGVPVYEADFASGAIEAHNGVVGAAHVPATTALLASEPAINITQGTDVLTIRLADPEGARLRQAMVLATDQVVTRIPADTASYVNGALLVVSDCEKATIFQTSGVTTAANSLTFAHAAAGVPGNSTTSLGGVYGTDATIHALRTQTFYVGPGSEANNFGDVTSSLWTRIGSGAPVELVGGVENLQFLFGVDISGDGVVDRYLTADAVGDMTDVVTLRITITTNSIDVVDVDDFTAGFDGLLRQSFSSTVAIRNRL